MNSRAIKQQPGKMALEFETQLHREIGDWWARAWSKPDRFARFAAADQYVLTLEKRRLLGTRGLGVVLNQIWLAPELQRRGICSRLLRECLERLPRASFVLVENVSSAEMAAFMASIPNYEAVLCTSDYIRKAR